MSNFETTIMWGTLIILIGIVFFPLTSLIFSKFFDRGYGLSKITGLVLISFTVFLLSMFKILAFTQFNTIFIFAVFAALNLWIFAKHKKKISTHLTSNSGVLIFEELFFLLGLFFWSYVRSRQPDINGLEKLMDFGFVNTIVRSEFLPPIDMWASGEYINYYWFGHFVTALLTKLSSIPSGHAYNLMLGTILGLSLTASFSLITSLISKLKNIPTRVVIISGIISAVLLNFAGNFHTPYFVLKNGIDNYWYPDATRFIGYNPDIEDKTIHEFPIYSYVVSDLHAHLLNLPFVLLYLSLLFSYISDSKNKIGQTVQSRRLTLTKNIVINIERHQSKLIFLGTILGIMFMTNAWDFANYSLVTGFVFLFAFFNKRQMFESIFEIAIKIFAILLVALIVMIPFLLNFQSIAEGVLLTHTKTPLWQLAILWGFPAILTLFFTFGLLKKAKLEDKFIGALLVASWLLIFIPEFIYVKDIYAASHYRANTMFKLTYQAFVMFYLSSGYIMVTLLRKSNTILLKIVLIAVFSTLSAAVLYYPFLAVKSYYGRIFSDTVTQKSLSGDKWLAEKYPDTLLAVEWFNNNVNGQPVILEAPGDSYTDYNTISSYTGLPTVSGWYVHEWLWRGTPDFPGNRVNDITEIYNTESAELAKSLLSKYKVKYVVVGHFEREKFPTLNEQKFLLLGNKVFQSGLTTIYQLL